MTDNQDPVMQKLFEVFKDELIFDIERLTKELNAVSGEVIQFSVTLEDMQREYSILLEEKKKLIHDITLSKSNLEEFDRYKEHEIATAVIDRMRKEIGILTIKNTELKNSRVITVTKTEYLSPNLNIPRWMKWFLNYFYNTKI